jgi:IPT/TIG domain-containing protein
LNGASTELIFSTYVGDIRGFQVSGLALDPNGEPIFCGSTGDVVFVAKYDLSGIPAVRLDGLANAASQFNVPVSSGEIISVTGSGFGSDARLLFDSWPALILSRTPERLTAVVPYALEGKTVVQSHVESFILALYPLNASPRGCVGHRKGNLISESAPAKLRVS